MNADGSNPTRVTSSPNAELFPVWSPDGNRIAFDSNAAAPSNFDVYHASAVDGSDPVRVTSAAGFDGRCDWGRAVTATSPAPETAAPAAPGAATPAVAGSPTPAQPSSVTPTGASPGQTATRRSRAGLSFRVTPRRDRRGPFRFTIGGRLTFPASLGAASACRGKSACASKRAPRRSRCVARR